MVIVVLVVKASCSKNELFLEQNDPAPPLPNRAFQGKFSSSLPSSHRHSSGELLAEHSFVPTDEKFSAGPGPSTNEPLPGHTFSPETLSDELEYWTEEDSDYLTYQSAGDGNLSSGWYSSCDMSAGDESCSGSEAALLSSSPVQQTSASSSKEASKMYLLFHKLLLRASHQCLSAHHLG